MTLQDLGNLGEFVASVAVIVSLIYLAVQIRQNSRLVRSEIDQAQTDGHTRYLALLAQDADLARLCRRGLAQEPLDEDERFRFSWLMHHVFAQLQSAFFHYRSGIISAEQWETPRRVAALWLASPAVRAWWRRENRIFRDEFVRHVERELVTDAGTPS
ncbi:MAG: hypothetical protein R3263_09775 [Myxococcota bacterium]|nr:hypothetical protein [Myxococcota bacterium]